MNFGKLFTRLLPFAILILIALFIYNIYEHGVVEHPGQALFAANCAQCHGENGEGIKVLVPPMTDKDFLRNNFDSLPCWLKNGLFHPVTINGIVFDQPMYPGGLDEIQTANVINYLNKQFAGSDKEINSAWVKQKWKECK